MKIQSVLAVLAGVAVTVLLSLLTDRFIPYSQPMTNMQCVIATTYRTLYGIFGSYLIAQLAPNRPMGHAMVSGLLGTLAGIGGVFAALNATPSLGPLWYPVALVITALPAAWAGARIFENSHAT